MPDPLRPRPPTTVLVRDPDARRDAPDDELDMEAPAQDEVAAGFLKNAIDKPSNGQVPPSRASGHE